MSSAILVTFSAADVQRFGERRTSMLLAAIIPALNLWAGEPVWIERGDDGEYLVCGGPRVSATEVSLAIEKTNFANIEARTV